MRKRVLNIGKNLLSQKTFCLLTIMGFLFFIIPLLYVGRYNHAASDDYWFAFHVHCSWVNTHNLVEVFKTAVSESAQFYVNWQGTYGSIFFMALSPFAFGEQYAHAVPYIMIGMTCISTMQCAFMYTPASGLFWWNAAAHYVFMQGFWNLMTGFALLSFERMYRNRDRRIWWSLETAVCTGAAFMAAGGNFSTALLTAETLALLGIYRKKFFLLFLPNGFMDQHLGNCNIDLTFARIFESSGRQPVFFSLSAVSDGHGILSLCFHVYAGVLCFGH